MAACPLGSAAFFSGREQPWRLLCRAERSGLRTAAHFRVAAVVPEDEVSGGLVVE